MFNSLGKRLHIHNIKLKAIQQKERLKSCMRTLQGQCTKANVCHERVFQF